MKFCPSCEVRLRKSETGLVCGRCGYSVAGDRPSGIIIEQQDSEFNVLDGTDGKEALPTIRIDCEKCGHGEAVWWMLQTRSADEPTTQFYRCTECNHTWRDYS